MKETESKRKNILSLTSPLKEMQSRGSSNRRQHSTDNRKDRGSIPLPGTNNNFKVTAALIPVIQINDKYIQAIRNGVKQSTIRRGRRAYPISECILQGRKDKLKIKIHNIKQKSFHDFSPSEAKKEGLDSLDTLWQELTLHYPDLQKDEKLTIVNFSYVNG